MSYNINKAYLLNSGPLLKKDCISISQAAKNSSGTIEISSSTPIYSHYTGNLIAYGSIPARTICDAPLGNIQYGLSYSVIFCDENGNYTAFAIG